MATSTFTVTGMTCDHCVTSVREEVSEIPGVNGVEIDLDSGRLVINSEDGVDETAVATAVDEAGYKLRSQ